uniref:Putative secreted protein n=1 Tax=Anopheles triannulatus TaxID=58253 RepID=A0A2M4B4K2_9DIPT
MSYNPYRSMRNAAVLVYMLLAGGSLASRSRDCNCHLPSPPAPRDRFHEKRHHEKRARICRMLDQMLTIIPFFHDSTRAGANKSVNQTLQNVVVV